MLKKRYATVGSSVAPAVPAFGGALLPSAAAAVVVSTPKTAPIATSISPAPSAAPSAAPATPSASSMVPSLCAELNIAPPTYKLVQSSAQTPDFWDGEARFEHAIDPCLRGAVGRVERVYGKKNAKDKIVQQVLEMLEGVKQQRMAG